MPLEQFTLESLSAIDDGVAALAFGAHLKRAAQDCEDRPADKKARKVTLEVTLIPVLEPKGDCVEVRAQVHAKSTVPVHQTKAYSLGLRRGGMLTYNPDSLGNVKQRTMLDDEK